MLVKTSLGNMLAKSYPRLVLIGAVLVLSVASVLPVGVTKKTSALTPGNGAPTPVYRWWQSTDKDWASIPAHGWQKSDAAMTSASYTKNTAAQYYVNMISTTDSDMVAVYRWWNNTDKDWVDIREGSPSDASLSSWGYTNKTFQYYAYSTPATGRVAVNRWWSDADKDWITLRQDEISDSTLTSWGYTNKTLVVYAYSSQSPSGEMGYFSMGAPQSAVVPTSFASGQFPHTMSVVDVNPSLSQSINNGYRYLGYFGHNYCGGIYIARSNDLSTSAWQQDSTVPTFTGTTPCRWASALVDGSQIDLAVSQVWNSTITAQTSTDGLNGTAFGTPTILVSESGAANGNPTLFKDPNDNKFYLYWYRHVEGSGLWEIRVKSSTTFSGLIGSGSSDLGQVVASSHELIAAPQVMYYGGKYYLGVETREGDQVTSEGGCINGAPGAQCAWKTRMLTGTSPTGPFYEIPANPIYGTGAACVFQHVVNNVLHSYYCKQNDLTSESSWTLDHVTADLTSPN
jgi:hypothetical protein